MLNPNETGLFYRALPTCTMVAQGEEAQRSKKATKRIRLY